jgi:hypothetical protein
MTAKKFPKTSPEPSEREPVRLGAPPPRRAKLAPTTRPANEKPTLSPRILGEGQPAAPPPEPPRLAGRLALRGPALRDEGGLVAASPQPPRLGHLPPEKNDTQKVIRRLRKSGKTPKKR